MLDATISSAEALKLLLFSRSFRERWLAGERHSLGLEEEELLDLDTIDRAELLRTCRRIVDNLLGGNAGGAGGLMTSFPHVFQFLQKAGWSALEVVESFMESPQFTGYREVHGDLPSLCIEEAFYQFLRKWAGAPFNALAEHEFLTALLSILVVNPVPGFRIDCGWIGDNGICQYAVRTLDPATAQALGIRVDGDFAQQPLLHLYAATRERYIAGPVPPLVAALVSLGTRQRCVAAQAALTDEYGVTPNDVAQLAPQLVSMGLMA